LSFSSPNRMVRNYYTSIFRRFVQIERMPEGDDRNSEIALLIITAVTLVEVFLNVYFRVLVTEERYRHLEIRVIRDLEARKGLGYKLHSWPKLLFGEQLSENSAQWSRFANVQAQRNLLVHFSSSHTSLQFPGITLNGMADTSVFDDLSFQDAVESVEATIGIISDIFVLQGIPEDALPGQLHSWLGRPPRS
jgi:hypothetical protein